jgi:hypothetical protein
MKRIKLSVVYAIFSILLVIAFTGCSKSESRDNPTEGSKTDSTQNMEEKTSNTDVSKDLVEEVVSDHPSIIIARQEGGAGRMYGLSIDNKDGMMWSIIMDDITPGQLFAGSIEPGEYGRVRLQKGVNKVALGEEQEYQPFNESIFFNMNILSDSVYILDIDKISGTSLNLISDIKASEIEKLGAFMYNQVHVPPFGLMMFYEMPGIEIANPENITNTELEKLAKAADIFITSRPQKDSSEDDTLLIEGHLIHPADYYKIPKRSGWADSIFANVTRFFIAPDTAEVFVVWTGVGVGSNKFLGEIDEWGEPEKISLPLQENHFMSLISDYDTGIISKAVQIQ